jgi:hypothetical protein
MARIRFDADKVHLKQLSSQRIASHRLVYASVVRIRCRILEPGSSTAWTFKADESRTWELAYNLQ